MGDADGSARGGGLPNGARAGTETEVWVKRNGRAEQLFVNFAYQPVRDPTGQIGGVLLSAADVTAHVRARRRHEALAAQVSDIKSELTYASAGHPPPLLITGSGAEYLDGVTGVMLGTGTNAVYPADVRRLPPGAGLLLYTDGLIEDRRRDISAGLGALAGVVRQSAARTAEQMCTAAQRALLGTAPRSDDVCLLAVRTPG